MAIGPSDRMKEGLIGAMPHLRAFALSLCGNSDTANDLVQETLVNAWSKFDTFEEGTNLKAWLFTILRNAYYTQFRKYGRETADVDGEHASRLAVHPDQLSHLDMVELLNALDKLPPEQREAIVLVAAEGFAYEEAAEICNCAVGTIKSRVNRGRAKLAELMHLDGSEEFGPDQVAGAVIDQPRTVARR